MRENSIIKQNILKYLDFKGVSKYEFYQKTGVSNGDLTQKNGFSEENTLRTLSYYSDLNPTWLLTGKGEMLNNGTPDSTFSRDVHKLIPYVDIEAVGGFGSESLSIDQSNITDYYDIPLFKNKKVDFICPVRGNSMLPRYQSGDLVACTIVRENTFIQWNEIHVVATRDQGILLKRVKKSKTDGFLTMISEDKDFEPFDVPKSEITGIALVVGSIRLE